MTLTCSGRISRFGGMSLSAPEIVRLGAQNPGHPWWYIAQLLVERLIGFGDPILPERRMSIVTPPALQGARHNPIEVALGELEVGITTPAVSARMAAEGTGVFDRSYEGLRAIASYPHIDFVVFAVDAATGIDSFETLIERRYPLKLVTGRRSSDGFDDVLTFTVEEVLRQYGISYATIEEWGGQVFYGGPTHIGGHLVLDGTAEAIFQEAQTSAIWKRIFASREFNVLSVSEQAREHMLGTYGFAKAEIPPGHYPCVHETVPTVDFSGWLVFCREDLPDEWAYAIARACDETRPRVDDGDPEVMRSLRLPVDPRYLFTETAIPLHEGAAAYAREHGYLG
jgi:TRAP-type uncharacterized transport system substrate-binding protein